MTHEPECRYIIEDDAPRTGACIWCGIARAAYQRGREDAAKAVEDWVNSEEGSDPVWFGLNGAIKAARGESEQK